MRNKEYGYYESNGLANGRLYHGVRNETNPDTVDWTEPGLVITRLRLLGDPDHPFLDVSYCHGLLDGNHVDVQLPFNNLPKRGFKKAIVDYAIKSKVYAKKLGILNPTVISILI